MGSRGAQAKKQQQPPKALSDRDIARVKRANGSSPATAEPTQTSKPKTANSGMAKPKIAQQPRAARPPQKKQDVNPKKRKLDVADVQPKSKFTKTKKTCVFVLFCYMMCLRVSVSLSGSRVRLGLTPFHGSVFVHPRTILCTSHLEPSYKSCPNLATRQRRRFNQEQRSKKKNPVNRLRSVKQTSNLC